MLEQQQIQQQWEQRQLRQQQQQRQQQQGASNGATAGEASAKERRAAGRDEDRAPDDVLMGTGVDLKEEEALLGAGGGNEVGAGTFYGRGSSRYAAAGTAATHTDGE